MNSDTAGRRGARATLIPLLLIVVGIFVWGVRYKLSLYDSPVSPSRSVAEAKLLSPNERPGSVQTASQIRPQIIPSSHLYFQIVLIATIFMSILPARLIRINAAASPLARYHADCSSSFFSFRPPPSFLIA
jgi:hypothetical protein